MIGWFANMPSVVLRCLLVTTPFYVLEKKTSLLRAMGESKIEIQTQKEPEAGLAELLGLLTEREGFDRPEIRNLLIKLYLRIKSCNERDLARLEDVLKLHGFLPSRDAF
jgi:hypothetical protein